MQVRAFSSQPFLVRWFSGRNTGVTLFSLVSPLSQPWMWKEPASPTSHTSWVPPLDWAVVFAGLDFWRPIFMTSYDVPDDTWKYWDQSCALPPFPPPSFSLPFFIFSSPPAFPPFSPSLTLSPPLPLLLFLPPSLLFLPSWMFLLRIAARFFA